MTVDLLFFQPLNTSHPVDLVFRETAESDGSSEVSFAISLSVSASFELTTSEGVSFNIALAPPFLSAVLEFDNAVSRGLRASAGGRWQNAAPVTRRVDLPYQQADKLSAARRTRWSRAEQLPGEPTDTPWAELLRTARPTADSRWAKGTKLAGYRRSAGWAYLDRSKRPQTLTRWQEATLLGLAENRQRWQERSRTARPRHTTLWGAGTPVSLLLVSPAGESTTLLAATETRWQEGRYPPPGRHTYIRPEPPVPEPCYVPPPGLNVEILFDQRLDFTANLFFICKRNDGPPATVVVPVRRVYMIANDATLTRADDGTLIPTYSMSMSLDVDSWTWSFGASVPGEALSALEPDTDGTPVEVQASVNGVSYRFLVESIQRERSYNTSRLSISGRGKSALLDSPYAPSLSFYNTADRTAQQLVADVLTSNGVPLGWDVAWGLTDWLVPAGAFSQSGSYINALNAIAAAAGGYVQPHNTDEALSVLARYPTAPWDWATTAPDFELPSALTTRESIAWAEKVRYNGVYVSGTKDGGIQALVKRVGTDGSLLAPMVTDPLITAPAAARQRGVSILSDTGRIATVGLRLPVLPSTGIIPPGKMVRYVDGGTVRMGITRSVNVDISMPAIWQNLSVETHV